LNGSVEIAITPEQALILEYVGGKLGTGLSPVEAQLCIAALVGGVVESQPGPRPKIRAKLIQVLCADRTVSEALSARGLWCGGLELVGPLDLKSCHFAKTLVLANCSVPGGIDLMESAFGTVSLQGSLVRHVLADNLVVHGNLFLRDGFECGGTVRLHGARIHGDLDCSRAVLSNKDAPEAAKEPVTINFQSAYVKGSVSFRGANSFGTVFGVGAKIDGDLVFDGARLYGTDLKEPTGRWAAICDGATVGGCVHLTKGLECVGMLGLKNARIQGDVVCGEAQVRNYAGEMAFVLDGASVQGDLLFHPGFVAVGKVRMLGLVARNIAMLRGSFSRSQQFPEAILVGSSEFNTIMIREPFVADGSVAIVNSTVQTTFDCNGGSFRCEEAPALNLQGTKVRGTLSLNPGSFTGGLHLSGASAVAYADNKNTWPAPGQLSMAGFQYEAIVGIKGAEPVTKEDRLAWLKLPGKESFSTQPYEVLSKYFKSKGQSDEAVQVQIEKNVEIRRHGGYSTIDWVKFCLFGCVTRFGYRSRWVLVAIACMIIVGTVGFWRAERAGMVCPTSERVLMDFSLWKAKRALPAGYPEFQPFAYAVETLIPFLELGQKKSWRPDNSVYGGRWLQWFVWAFAAIGWYLSTLAVVSLTGLMKKE